MVTFTFWFCAALAWAQDDVEEPFLPEFQAAAKKCNYVKVSQEMHLCQVKSRNATMSRLVRKCTYGKFSQEMQLCQG